MLSLFNCYLSPNEFFFDVRYGSPDEIKPAQDMTETIYKLLQMLWRIFKILSGVAYILYFKVFNYIV